MARSLIYRNIHVYRAVMQVLYLGRYPHRYTPVTDLFGKDDNTILELCFGDTIIAAHCADTDRKWRGLDINEAFVKRAAGSGYDAAVVDINMLEQLPDADIVVMAGSLYHFHTRLENLVEKMLRAAPRVIISEPVRNYSQAPGVVGWLARRAANPGTKKQEFRYNEATLLEAFGQARAVVGFNFSVEETGKDMIIQLSRG